MKAAGIERVNLWKAKRMNNPHIKGIERRGDLVWALAYNRHLYLNCTELGRSNPISVKEAWDYADLAKGDFIDESIRQDRAAKRLIR